jgi:hypothetical protein
MVALRIRQFTEAYGLVKSAVSEQFIEVSRAKLKKTMERRLGLASEIKGGLRRRGTVGVRVSNRPLRIAMAGWPEVKRRPMRKRYVLR